MAPEIRAGSRKKEPTVYRPPAFSLEQAAMPNAIEKIVDTYVRLNDRQKLENLRTHRQRLAINFRARPGYDFSLPLLIVEDEIAIIEAGLKRLAGAAQVV